MNKPASPRSLLLALALTALPSLARAQTPLAGGRAHHAQATLPDGRVLVTGGERVDDLVAWGAGAARALSREATLFDPATGRWSPAGRLVHPRANHAVVALPDGRAVVLGGGASELRPDPSVEQWDPASRAWRVVGRLADGRSGHTATRLDDGRVLVVGGARDTLGSAVPGANVLRSVELWDPRARRAAPAAPLPVALTRHAAVRLADGRVLVTGGTSWWGGAPAEREPVSARAFVWSPATNAWREVSPMRGARVGHAMTALRDGRVLVVGNRVGHDQTSCAWTDEDCARHPVTGDEAELFDPRDGTFTATGTTRFPRLGDHQLAALADGRVAVFGVMSTVGGEAPQVVEVWGPATGEWSDHGDLAVSAQDGFRATPLADGRVLVTGAHLVPNRAGLLRAGASFGVWDPAVALARPSPRTSTLARAVLE